MDGVRVTDPDLIRLLEAREAPAGGLPRVTDPDLIRQLNAPEPAPEAPPRADGRAHGALNAAARGFVGGVPVLGPALLGGIDHADAAVRSLTGDGRYSDEMAKAQGYGADVAAEHPIAHVAGEVAGGIAGTVPLMMAAPAAFGAGAGGLAVRSAASLASSGTLGGADAAVRSGGDLEATKKGALAGATLGAIAPGAGQLVGAGVRAVAGRVAPALADTAGLSRRAVGALADDVGQAGGVDAVRARMAELGEHAMLLDGGAALEGRAQGLAAQPATRDTVTAPLRERAAGAGDRLAVDVDGALGPAVSSAAAVTDLTAQRAVPNGAIGDVLKAADPVNTQSVLGILDQRIGRAVGGEKAALEKARGLLAHEDPATGWVTMENDPQRLHGIKQELDSMIQYGEPGLGIPAGALQRKDGALRGVRSDLNGLLRSRVAGYAEANDASAALARQIEAVDAGSTLLRSGEAATAPADLARRLAAMSPEERAAMATGTRGAVDRAMGTAPDDVAALRGLLQGEHGWNTQNLAQLHGQEPVARVAGAVEREGAFADTHRRVVGAADDAARRAAADAVTPRTFAAGPGDVVPAVAGVLGGVHAGAAALAAKAGIQGARAGVNAVGRGRDLARNAELADAVTAQQGEYLERLLAAITAREVAARGGVAAGRAAQIGTQAGVVSQADRLRGHLPFGFVPALR